MTQYQTDGEEFHWTIQMRYYTSIDQANPTDAGSFSDEFDVIIWELQYDPCNDNTLTAATTVPDHTYAWTEDMSNSDKYADLEANTFTTTDDECEILTELQI